MAIVITTAIEKGGTGKTTTVVNLAALMAQDGKHVLVVDMDQQANATYSLTGHKKGEDFFKNAGLCRMFRMYEKQMDVSRYIHASRIAGVDLIPSTAQTPRVVGQLEVLASEDADNPSHYLSYVLANVADQYDYILIDTPPSRDVLTISALLAADYVVIPLRCDEYSLDGLLTTATMIHNLEKEENTTIKILGVLLTQTERTAVVNLTREELEESNFSSLVFHQDIRKGSAVPESTKVAEPVVTYNKNSNPAKDYRELYNEIKKRISEMENEFTAPMSSEC